MGSIIPSKMIRNGQPKGVNRLLKYCALERDNSILLKKLGPFEYVQKYY